MKPPTEYTTSFGLYRAAMRAATQLDGCKRGWWMQNALWYSENILNDPELNGQIRQLFSDASPKTTAQLSPRG